ncbi:molecular chaperone DnaJ [Myroides odoratimimus]|uniref:molecular chaperone DnaJ n=1 Tax=Myroides odoratimimus TaxID=76832 RepID=UPI0025769556|nr:molecular chaperone DnaJ [Myroides odoratimimus]MDM1085862.1 molecular chaperone DnaJ [Myroides odoratimimus]
MKDTLTENALKVAEQTISISSNEDVPTSVWLWIAILELVIIIGLVFSKKFKRKSNHKLQFKKEALSQDIDFNNIISSSFHSNELYDALKVKCHPDRFPTDPELNEIADKLFQEITKNKTNHKRLEELKIEAKQKLNINL